PEASVFPELADAAADLQEGFLEDVFGVFGRPADSPAEVVHGDFESAIQRLKAGWITGFGLGHDRLGVGHQVGVHDERFRHDQLKMPGRSRASQQNSVNGERESPSTRPPFTVHRLPFTLKLMYVN